MTSLSPDVNGLVERQDGLPEGWSSRGNVLMAPPEVTIPPLDCPPRKEPPRDSVVRLGWGDTLLKVIRLWGAGNVVELANLVVAEAGTICCGDGARVRVGENTLLGEVAYIDARNGGSIMIGADGLWSYGVRVATDDMHAILDLQTGRRINKRGSDVVIGRHVWIGDNAVVMPGAVVGDDSIIGARSIVSGATPANTVCAGAPARVIREGVTWSIDDLAD
jgi:acetyltransferase-like isoleucine patch superfamily enzyme